MTIGQAKEGLLELLKDFRAPSKQALFLSPNGLTHFSPFLMNQGIQIPGGLGEALAQTSTQLGETRDEN